MAGARSPTKAVTRKRRCPRSTGWRLQAAPRSGLGQSQAALPTEPKRCSHGPGTGIEASRADQEYPEPYPALEGPCEDLDSRALREETADRGAEPALRDSVEQVALG